MSDTFSYRVLFQGLFMVGLDGQARLIRDNDALEPSNDLLLLNANADRADLKAAIERRRKTIDNFLETASSPYQLKLPGDSELAELYKPYAIAYITSQQLDADYKKEILLTLNKSGLSFYDIKSAVDLSSFPDDMKEKIQEKSKALVRGINKNLPILPDADIPDLDIEKGRYAAVDPHLLKAHIRNYFAEAAEKKLSAIEHDADNFLKSVHASIHKKRSVLSLRNVTGLLDYTHMKKNLNSVLITTTAAGAGTSLLHLAKIMLEYGIQTTPESMYLASLGVASGMATDLLAGRHIKGRWSECAPAHMPNTKRLFKEVEAVYNQMPKDIKDFLTRIQPDFFISPTLNYLRHVDNHTLIVGGTASHAPESGSKTIIITETSAKDDEDKKKNQYKEFDDVIHLNAINFCVLFEEAKHVIHRFVGFSHEDWQEAALKELGTADSTKLLRKYGNKPANWHSYAIYKAHDKSLYAAEILVELDHAYFVLTEKEKKSPDQAFQIIEQHMPECGTLFRSYKAKEAKVLTAIRDKDEVAVRQLIADESGDHAQKIMHSAAGEANRIRG